MISFLSKLFHRCNSRRIQDYHVLQTYSERAVYRKNLNPRVSQAQDASGLIEKHTEIKIRCKVCGRIKMSSLVSLVKKSDVIPEE